MDETDDFPDVTDPEDPDLPDGWQVEGLAHETF